MAIDIREISLSDDQKRRIAELAEETGRSWRDVLNEQLGTPMESVPTRPYWSYKDSYIKDPQRWRAYFREWISKQTSHNPNFDDSRESIYD